MGGCIHTARIAISLIIVRNVVAECGSGIVSFNIANKTPACPWSPNHKISRIGGSYSDRLERRYTQEAARKAAMSLLERIGLRASTPKTEQIEAAIICQWDNHEIIDKAYPCPMCRKTTLRFNNNGDRFD